MKSTNTPRNKNRDFDSEDSMKRAAKLDPIKKSGKERHALYSRLDDDEDFELQSLKKRESAFDYFDDGDENEEEDEEQEK